MKKLLVVLVVVSLMMVFASTAFAAPGGMPGAHGADNMACASELAQSAPGAVAEHMGKGSANGFGPGGMPAAHGADNMACASELAQSAPGAVAEHMGRR